VNISFIIGYLFLKYLHRKTKSILLTTNFVKNVCCYLLLNFVFLILFIIIRNFKFRTTRFTLQSDKLQKLKIEGIILTNYRIKIDEQKKITF